MTPQRRHVIYMLFLDFLPMSIKERENLIAAGISEASIEDLMIRPVPERFYNELVCWRLARDYGALWGADGFARNGKGEWFFDVDPRYEGRGLFCTERTAGGYIVGIRLFRHLRDPHGFRVRTRQSLISA